jgi:MoxR-like ATPase
LNNTPIGVAGAPPEPPALRLDFVGRTQLLEDLRRHLVERIGKVLLTGEPGIGKTELATAFASLYRADFDSVLMISCTDASVSDVAVRLVSEFEADMTSDTDRRMRSTKS